MFGVVQYILGVSFVSFLQIYHSVCCFVFSYVLVFYAHLIVQQVGVFPLSLVSWIEDVLSLVFEQVKLVHLWLYFYYVIMQEIYMICLGDTSLIAP